MIGFPCHTFVWLAMGHTGRRASIPLGNENRHDVAAANLMFLRILVLIKLLSLRSVFWLLENPLRSLIWKQPGWLALMKFIRIRSGVRVHRPSRHLTWFGSFGCDIAKPVLFWGIAPGAIHIRRKRPAWFGGKQRKQTLGWVSWNQLQPDGSLKRRFMGRRALKSTGMYPAGLRDVIIKITKWQKAHFQKGTL